jgi:DNA polymerase I-like protein with 3'-5' exonuclease and polymerase domains
MPYIDFTGEAPARPDPFETYQLYNLLDCFITAQLVPPMRSQLDESTAAVYQREMRVQQLCLEMSSTGFPINKEAVAELTFSLTKNINKATNRLTQWCEAVGYPALNENSPKQVADFFYSFLKLPPINKWDFATRSRKIVTDAKALESLASSYIIAAPFVNAILSIRESRKMLSVFNRGLEPNGNLRCTFSPSGTDTGRLSSQSNPYKRGTNAQNITDYLRHVIEAPPGFLILNFDLKTAESIAVGFLSQSPKYIDACYSGDIHTYAAKEVWPKQPWTGDLRLDKAIAENPCYRHFSFRDLAKRGGHGTNYYGKPPNVAKHLGVPTPLVADFQASYFAAFPEIPTWHLRVIAEIQTTGQLTTPLARKRTFWGRSGDASTHRKAIAFGPQSLVADTWNEALYIAQMWLVANYPSIRLLAQVHDSGVFLFPKQLVHSVVPLLQKQLEYPIDFGKLGVMTIPTDVTIGRTWNKLPKGNAPKHLAGGQRPYIAGMDLNL